MLYICGQKDHYLNYAGLWKLMKTFYAAFAAIWFEHWFRTILSYIICNWDRCGWRGVISYHYLYSLLLEEKVEYSDFDYLSKDKKNPQNKHILDENISCAGTSGVNVFTGKILY